MASKLDLILPVDFIFKMSRCHYFIYLASRCISRIYINYTSHLTFSFNLLFIYKTKTTIRDSNLGNSCESSDVIYQASGAQTLRRSYGGIIYRVTSEQPV